MLASESFNKNNIVRKVEHVELVFVIEIASKTKAMLTRAQHENIKKQNAEREQALRDKNRVRTKKKGEAENRKEKVKDTKEGKRVKGLKTGMWALKEIKKYQTSTDLLI